MDKKKKREGEMKTGPKEILLNEKGMALMLALVMLVMLTLIGFAAVNTSTTEVALSGNYRLHADSFYVAESGLTYVMTNGTNLTGGGGSSTVTLSGAKQANVTTNLLLSAGPAPAGTGTGIRTARTADYYSITSTAAANGVSKQVEVVARLNPATY